MKRMKNERGFTLIELLVVIVILGILAAVVVFAVGGLGDKGQSNACAVDERTLRTAEEAHYAANNQGVYDTEANLEAENFIEDVSSLHNIDETGLPDSYDVVPVVGGKCDV